MQQFTSWLAVTIWCHHFVVGLGFGFGLDSTVAEVDCSAVFDVLTP